MAGTTALKVIDAATVERLLDYPSLVAKLREAFLAPPTAPSRQAVPIEAAPGQTAGTLLVMPAVRPGKLIGVKLVTVLPELGNRPGGALRAIYMVLDAASGEPLGTIDGHALTTRRTAAASVLAASVLASPEPETLLVVGTGSVAEALAEAYWAVLRPKRVLIWGRNVEKAEALAASLHARGIAASAAGELAEAVGQAQIVSAATLAREPIILGDQVRPGTHIDLVGGFRRDMRESDDALVRKARVVVDVPHTKTETGDIAQPLAAGVLDAADVTELAELLGEAPRWRRAPEDITLFKSAGHALEDLAGAELVMERLGAEEIA
ncbi:ornithine cyclodeaminase family protein [Devosia sp. 1566]|uniref:ornithine cyclodeaminase family protein n=1 Tax=Devosia sp. 1566 TaxID=2499144 RepID=UPI000FD8A248|nr:ornithine cyclodeaminase family protein [Devosia sp. 1566]